MTDPLYTPYPPVYAFTHKANVPVEVSSGLMSGGALIQNPQSPIDQGLPVAEPLRIDMVDNLGTLANSITLGPGDYFRAPLNFNGTIWAISQTPLHRFSAVIIFPYVGFKPFPPQPGAPGFPPWTPETFVTAMKILRSYLYQQYNDDEDLQVFVMTYNDMTQAYITWFSTVMLPVYAENPMVSGALLDYVGQGLYGLPRPTLASGQRREIGTFNSAMFNESMFNEDILLDPTDLFVTDDDTYRRILTWHLYKGDGKLFNIRWLKRRVMRFLTGADGGNGESTADGSPTTPDMYPPDQTYLVSVTFGADDQININLQSTHRSILDGAMFNAGMFNQFEFNELGTEATYTVSSPWAPIFKSAVESGALELPFQYSFVVNIN